MCCKSTLPEVLFNMWFLFLWGQILFQTLFCLIEHHVVLQTSKNVILLLRNWHKTKNVNIRHKTTFGVLWCILQNQELCGRNLKFISLLKSKSSIASSCCSFAQFQSMSWHEDNNKDNFHYLLLHNYYNTRMFRRNVVVWVLASDLRHSWRAC